MIREIAVVALALGGLTLSPLTVASAQSGDLCGFASITDPAVEGDVQTGEIDGGPLFAADVDNPGEETADISIRCTIQVGAQGGTHAGADAYIAEGPTQAGVAVLPAHQFSYVAPVGAPVYECTQAEVNGQIRYFDADNPFDPADFIGWSTSSGVDCVMAINQSVPTGEELDPFICPSLVVLFPPEGDIPGWDCPPYGSSEKPDPPEESSGTQANANAPDPWMIGCIDTNDGAICT